MKNAGAAPCFEGAALALAFGARWAAGWCSWAGGGQAYAYGSGFSSEAGYQAIYALSGEVSDAWERKASPGSGRRSGSDRAVDAAAGAAAAGGAWGSSKRKAPRTRAGWRDRPEATAWRLLYAAYLVNGPKVSTADEKAIAALRGGRGFRPSAQRCWAACWTMRAPVLPARRRRPDRLHGRRAAGHADAAVRHQAPTRRGRRTEHVNALKKSVRDKASQLEAFRMIARGEVSWLWQLVVSYSRTAILIGILVALDALLLALLMMGDGRWILDFKWIIILLIVDFLLLFQLMPLIYMVIKAFFPESDFSLETFRRLYTYPLNLDALKNTLIAAFATMILGTLIAFPLAWLVGRTNLYGKKFFRALFVLTYMVPPYVGAMAWLRLLNPNVGTINQWLRALLHLSDAPGPLNVYTLPGMIWVLTTFYYPYAFITISRAMEKMDPSLEEASRISGASPLKTVFTVTLPMMMPSLIAGALLVFVSAASCYGIPSIIGSPGRVHTVTTRIVEYVGLGQQGLNDATGMAVFLMVLAVIILFMSDVVLAKRQYITVSGKSVRPAIVDLRKWRMPLTVLVSLFAVIVVLIPFATIFSTSFKIDVGKSMLKADNFTLANWTTVFGRTETVNCLKKLPDLRRRGRHGGHRGRLHHELSAAAHPHPGPEDPGFPDHPGLRHALRGHRPGPDHDHEGQFRHQHLQHRLHHDHRLHDQVPDDGHAHGGLRHEPDPRVPGGVQPDRRRQLAAHHVPHHRAADLPLHRGGLVPDLHPQLLRAVHDHAAVFQHHQDHRLPAV